METPKTGDGLTLPLPMDRGLTPKPVESLDDSLAKLGRTAKVDQLRVQVVRRVRLLRRRRWVLWDRSGLVQLVKPHRLASWYVPVR